MIARVFLPVLLGLLLAPGESIAQDPAWRLPASPGKLVSAPPEHLRLREGRRFRRGPRLLVNVYPYWVAATKDEAAKGEGQELRLANAHKLLEPIETHEAAVELARLLTGGIVVPDETTYAALRAEAVRLQPSATGWGIEVEDGKPSHFGISASETENNWCVDALVFTCSGYGGLSVVEERFTIPRDGAVAHEAKTWIQGPPQSWQTSGDVDPEEEAKLHAEVFRFREALTAIFARSRTEAAVRAALEPDATFARIRRRLEEPDFEISGKVRRAIYRLADGSAVVFDVRDEDLPPESVLHVEEVTTQDATGPTVGKTLERWK